MACAVFHQIAHTTLMYVFSMKNNRIYEFATAFYVGDIKKSQSPFAWASSVSYTTALLLGFIVSNDYSVYRFEKLVLGPFHSSIKNVVGNFTLFLIPFSIWLGLLDPLLLPVTKEILKDSSYFMKDKSKLPTLEEAIDYAHAIAFSVGMLFIFVAKPATRIAAKYFSASFEAVDEFKKNKDKDMDISINDEDLDDEDFHENLIDNELHHESKHLTYNLTPNHIFDLFVTFVFVTGLLLTTLSRDELIINFFKNLPYFKISIYLTILSLITASLLLFFKQDNYERKIPKFVQDFVTIVVVTILWNSHSIAFLFVWFLAFPIYSLIYINDQSIYSIKDGVIDGTLWVFLGTYFFPVIFKGGLKIFSARMRKPWGLVQESIMTFVVLVPLASLMWYKWHTNTVVLPLYNFMLICYLLYLLTWRDRPEYTGWRDWPWLKSWRLWWVVQYYFQVRFIVDNKDPKKVFDTEKKFTKENGLADNRYVLPYKYYNRDFVLEGYEPNKARMFAFAPHGLFPCTMLWMHLIPHWWRTFGKLVPYTLVDAFVHCCPGMKEFMQWGKIIFIY